MKEQTEETKIALIQNDIGYIKKSLEVMQSDIKQLGTSFVNTADFEVYKREIQSALGTCVRYNEFTPVRNFVYALISIVLLTVLGAILKLVIFNQ